MTTPSTFSVLQPVGRLVLARWWQLHDVETAKAFRAAIMAAVLPVTPAIICADWRTAFVVSPAVSDELLAMLNGSNPHVAWSSILLAPEHATFNLQAERLVKAAAFSNRQTFRDPAALIEWLRSRTTTEETAEVERFLSSPRVG